MEKAETKRLLHWGWMTGEKRMLRELGDQAERGWFLERCTPLHLVLKKGAPRRMRYAVDMPCVRRREEPEYLGYFTCSGWKLVCKNGAFYIFAAEGEAPLPHTDRVLLAELRRRRIRWTALWASAGLALLAGVVTVGRLPGLPFALRAVCLLLAAAIAGYTGIIGTMLASLLVARNGF